VPIVSSSFSLQQLVEIDRINRYADRGMFAETKTPQEKKRLSLKKDRRNTYGENDKSSRNNIPRSKARSHRKVRRKVNEELQQTLWMEEVQADVLMSELSQLSVEKTAKRTWRKWPDKPLGEILKGKTKNEP
jgi:signal recognition particle GTPase